MALVFKTPKTAINTTTRDIQNIKDGECPPCPECPEVELTTAEVEYTENGSFTVTPESGFDGLTQVDITVNIPSVKNQDKLVVPTTSSQTITADSGYSGIGTVSVEAVTSSIDANIAAGNIKKNVSILGVTGSYDPQPTLQAKTATPTTSQQVITPDTGNDGLSQVTVTAVTAAIDENIQSENILSGVTILGVTGSDAGYTAGYDDGYAQGQAECPTPAYTPLDETITQNGTYTFDPTDYAGSSFDYFNEATITVNVSGGTEVVEPFTITSTEDNNTVKFRDIVDTGIEYSLDGGETWQQSVPTASGTVGTFYDSSWTLNNGDSVKLRNNRSTYYQDVNVFGQVISTGTFNVSGNISTIFSKTDPNVTPEPYALYHFFSAAKVVNAGGLTLLKNPSNNCFDGMFYSCTYLTVAPILPAAIIPTSCYKGMFRNCANLIAAPALPATVIGAEAYKEMFANCQSMTTAPSVLPAKSIENGSYYGMFSACTSLTTAPSLPATELKDNCYRAMFQGCTSLTTAPALPAIRLGAYCYSFMFYGCTALTQAPTILPATYFGSAWNYCYQSMFEECTSLTTAPELPAAAPTRYTYNNMFKNCTNLNYIKCLATNVTANNCVSNWVNGVAATGTFVKNADMSSWATGVSGIPDGWTVEDAS